MLVCGALGIWAAISAIRNRPASPPLIVATGVLLVVLLIQLVVCVVAFNVTGSEADAILFFGYLITAIVLVPLAGFWAFAELTRWGPTVLVAAALTVIIMQVRVEQLWA